MFEKCMMDNIRHLLKEIEDLKISRLRGRIWIQKRSGEEFSDKELEIARQEMPKAFGLETFSPVAMTEPDIDKLAKIVEKTCKPFFDKIIERKNKVSFRIRARRSDKTFPLDSKGIEIKLAETVGSVYDHSVLDIDLVNAEITVGCELRKEFAFIYYETIKGPGGLPVGSNSPVLALLSGGIDSPVACYMTMKRGCPVDYMAFHSEPYTPKETVDKVKKLAKILNGFQRGGKLYVCNLVSLQKLVRDKCADRFRTVIYRRMMFRIAKKVAEQNGNLALLTGESVGQVASQTIVNMNTIDNAVDMLVLRPLVGMDKNEAIEIARKIGTFEISKLQVPDSCTVFAPKSPSTNAPIYRVEKEEQRLGDYWKIIDEILQGLDIVDVTDV
jgi:thiamine biosynthesis protein ThiI